MVVAVAHGSAARGYASGIAEVDYVIPYMSDVPNISAMWRAGLDVARTAGATWVAVLNDDVIVPSTWFDALYAQAEVTHAAGASGWRAPDSQKIAGFAFILDVTSGVVPDERFRWWYSDDAIQRRCEKKSWFALVEDVVVEHRYPNLSTTGALRRISRADKPRFKQAYP